MHVIVIGAGLLGTSTAWFLRQRGFEVTVLERREGPALEASKGNGGYHQSGLPEHWNVPGIHREMAKAWVATWGTPPLDAAMMIRTRALPGLAGWGIRFLSNTTKTKYRAALAANHALANYSQETYLETVANLDLDCAARSNGGVWLFRDQQALDHYAAAAARMVAKGTEFSVLNPAELSIMEPALSPIADRLTGALHFAGEATGDPYLYCTQLEHAAKAVGAEFRYGQDVLSIGVKGSRFNIRTTNNDLNGDRVVLCAGASSPQLAAQLGVRLPIRPAKGYSITLPMKNWTNRPTHAVADMGLHAGTTPMGDDLRVAGTAEFAGFDNFISQNRIDSLRSMVDQIYPEFSDVMDHDDYNAWTGFRPLSADGLPFIGPTGIDGLYLNTGHGGLGWTQSAGSGKALADHIAGIDHSFDISPFALGR
jgi:D-amino-acid dehydrogenase